MLRKNLTILLCAVTILGMVGCTNSSNSTENTTTTIEQNQAHVNVKDVTTAIVNADIIPAPLEMEEEMVKERFYINLDDVEEYSAYECQRSPGVGTIISVKAKDGKIDNVKKSLEKVLEDKKNSFYPDEVEAAESAYIREDGNILTFVYVYPNVLEQANSILDKILK